MIDGFCSNCGHDAPYHVENCYVPWKTALAKAEEIVDRCCQCLDNEFWREYKKANFLTEKVCEHKNKQHVTDDVKNCLDCGKVLSRL